MTASAGSARPRIAIVGGGGIGGIVAATLAEADRAEVTLCVRRPFQRLTLERPDGAVAVDLPILTDPAAVGPVDWVLLATKAHEVPATEPWLRRLCTEGTIVAVLQNGIDHVERVAPYAGSVEILPTLVLFNAERLALDRVRHRPVAEADIIVPMGEAGGRFVDLFAGTRLVLRQIEDFRSRAWRKLLLNAVANTLSGLTAERNHIFRRDDIQALARDLLAEAVAVARADGADLAPDEAERTLATVLTYPVEAGTSMYFDRVAGRPMEVDAITGAVVRIGERHGVPTPINRTLLTLLGTISDAAHRRRQAEGR